MSRRQPSSCAGALPTAMLRPDFCIAKGFACVLCAAHLSWVCEAGDFVAGFAALLGRFLPRLGPHGPPRGPFYLRRASEFADSRILAQKLYKSVPLPPSSAFVTVARSRLRYCDAI